METKWFWGHGRWSWVLTCLIMSSTIDLQIVCVYYPGKQTGLKIEMGRWKITGGLPEEPSPQETNAGQCWPLWSLYHRWIGFGNEDRRQTSATPIPRWFSVIYKNAEWRRVLMARFLQQYAIRHGKTRENCWAELFIALFNCIQTHSFSPSSIFQGKMFSSFADFNLL